SVAVAYFPWNGSSDSAGTRNGTVLASAGGLPAMFLTGQADSVPSAAFQGAGITGKFLPGKSVLRWRPREAGVAEAVIEYADARPVRPVGVDALSIRLTVLAGEDGLPVELQGFEKLVYRDLYPGIDLMYETAGTARLKTTFVVREGADPGLVRLRYANASRVRIQRSGQLVVEIGKEKLVEEAPFIFQQRGDQQILVSGGYNLMEDGTVGFEVGEFDRQLPLVIDPEIVFSTYIGGSGFEAATAVAVDPKRNTYVGGWTESPDLITMNAFQPYLGGGVDAFVAKFNPLGQLVYCTFIGGRGEDRITGITVDWDGNAYATGWTTSSNFPKAAALQSSLAGGRDAFVLKLSASGSQLLFSTYWGGSHADLAQAVTLDGSGNVVIAGYTSSWNFPRVHSAVGHSGGDDVFVARFSGSGVALQSRLLGGIQNDRAMGVAVDPSGFVWLTGETASANFPLQSAIQSQLRGAMDAFVTKLSGDTTTILFSTYLGGSAGTISLPERATSIVADREGNAYVCGFTGSLDFPLANAVQIQFGGGTFDAFVAKISGASHTLAYSTYLGGSGVDQANALELNTHAEVFVGGTTTSKNFPLQRPIQNHLAGEFDAFVVAYSESGQTIRFGTYLGGTSSDTGLAMARDGTDAVYLAGQTLSTDFPLTKAWQSVNLGSHGGFIAKLHVLRRDRIGVFTGGVWALDMNGNYRWDGDPPDANRVFGSPGDIHVYGDWNGDGRTTRGVYRSQEWWWLDVNGNDLWDPQHGDRLHSFGGGTDVPIVGDWTGDGVTKIGVFRGGQWFLDLNGNGVWDSGDRFCVFGGPGDTPVAGDWTGDGKSKIGVYRPGQWLLDINNNCIWDPPHDKLFYFGGGTDVPIVGDWTGDGKSKIGVYRGGQWFLDRNANGYWDPPGDLFAVFGVPSQRPASGKW
ncbi:MAG: SBBP repeat-containing protein, partial [Fimbriimonadaceae bacterium]